MKRFTLPLTLGLCLVALISHQTTLAADTWVSVRTKNFFLVGNANEKSIRDVGLKLEQFREVFTYLFPSMKFNTPVPTTVVVFKSDSAYGPFKPIANAAGHFQAGDDVNYIALATEVRGEQDPFSIIFHEYTHLLVENTFDNAPAWFNEGLAEYYSTFSITNDLNVTLGVPIKGHIYRLRETKMLPLRTLFEVDYKSPHYNEKNKSSIFYAQSWALMHYLIVGKQKGGEQLGKFMALRTAKVPMEQAFAQAFAMSIDAMEKELQTYGRQEQWLSSRGHFAEKLVVDTTNTVTPLSEAEAHAYLGDLLVHSNRAEAHTYLQRALKLDPNLTMAHASLGMAYFREGRTSQAHASLERAVASNSQNYLAHYYYAFSLSRSGPNESPPVGGYSPEVAAKIREHLQKAIALRPDFPESYNLLAFLSLITGQDVDQMIAALTQILAASPGRHESTFMLGQLYLRKGEFNNAREHLEKVAKSNAEDQVRQHAEALLTQIRSFEEQVSRLQPVRQAGAEKEGEEKDSEPATKPRISKSSSMPVIVDDSRSEPSKMPEPAPPSDPSFYLREVLRPPVAGETQLQGTLQKIECDGKGIVFVVQTATGLLRLRTASFGDIELTTYDTTVKGVIGCGPRNPENVVVVCYIPNTDKKIKADGVLKSIEFVPADFKLKAAP